MGMLVVYGQLLEDFQKAVAHRGYHLLVVGGWEFSEGFHHVYQFFEVLKHCNLLLDSGTNQPGFDKLQLAVYYFLQLLELYLGPYKLGLRQDEEHLYYVQDGGRVLSRELGEDEVHQTDWDIDFDVLLVDDLEVYEHETIHKILVVVKFVYPDKVLKQMLHFLVLARLLQLSDLLSDYGVELRGVLLHLQTF